MSLKLPEKVDYEYVVVNLSAESGTKDSKSTTSNEKKEKTGTKSKKKEDKNAATNKKEGLSEIKNEVGGTATKAEESRAEAGARVGAEVDVNQIVNADGKLHTVSFLPKVLITNPSAMNAEIPENIKHVKGPDFDEGNGIDFIMNAFKTTGFQATSMADAAESILQMIHWRLTPEEVKSKEEELGHLSSEDIANARCTIFMGLTSNQISCGQREIILFLCKHNMIDCIVTTGGAVEEDIMKIFNPHYMGDFHLKGSELRVRGINRIVNIKNLYHPVSKKKKKK
ncbi:hypothetical protein RFI_30405 [Reticulomyxa filosa]|uniref:Deoxyhypusine synthase n=1 Tax=Reticulomyxa filosa TaxID=46433 RepID=X6M1X8_RETFI|nr:hypothetical protein RFI_30405 [Reticulomyxa filosa]|eukprot:ETO06985.1 hypothetical protein RFI_30405 [Reticulomyxa filosa]